MTCFNNIENYELALSLRGWGRRSSLYDNSEDYGSWLRSVMPILLYLTLMGLAILSGMGRIGTDGG